VTSRTRGSDFSTRALLVPRLHREEGDGMIIGMPGPEIKWGFWRSDPALPERPRPVKTRRVVEGGIPRTQIRGQVRLGN